ncbi:CLUMA_CG011113, isoform A [Clunio marinus]|uniref:CLUMA_CG011113, isoform A n=1 Tax=Clunio marinus TaxID=568069 RepID=A0A1J1IBS8_9DIPT|nr:CLUMA_CG011113, isoform A [Clunio marinus]
MRSLYDKTTAKMENFMSQDHQQIFNFVYGNCCEIKSRFNLKLFMDNSKEHHGLFYLRIIASKLITTKHSPL